MTINKWRFYTASIKNLQSSQRDQIELVKAKHLPSSGKMHVKAVAIENSEILLMPRFEKHFVQLAVLYITNCSLQEISKEVLPFHSLRLIYFRNNLIQSLERN